jgi:hypothetical protein
MHACVIVQNQRVCGSVAALASALAAESAKATPLPSLPSVAASVHAVQQLLADHGGFQGELMGSQAPPGTVSRLAVRSATTSVKYGASRHGVDGAWDPLIRKSNVEGV